MALPVCRIGWLFEKAEDGKVRVSYKSWHVPPSFNFEFDNVESANVFWEMVYPTSVMVEHDPYITDDVTGWAMRNALVSYYKRDLAGQVSDEKRALWQNFCAQIFVKPFKMCR